ncbi:MAG: hypothetical protein WCJ35_14545, partial [Planctomycetota bacterium]
MQKPQGVNHENHENHENQEIHEKGYPVCSGSRLHPDQDKRINDRWIRCSGAFMPLFREAV